MNNTPQTRSWLLASALIFLSLASANAQQFERFTYRDNGTSIEIVDYPKHVSGHVEIPSEIDGKPVTSITGGGDPNEFDGAFAFAAITSVTIPNTVTTIGDEAFGACFGLGSIVIPNSVTHIGHSAFYQSNGLTSVQIGENVTTIGELAFFKCFRLHYLAIPDSVVSIGDFAFDGCRAIRNLKLGSNLQTIGTSAFAQCNALRYVTVPSAVTELGSNCFSGCDSLTAAIFRGNAPGGTGAEFGNAFSRASPRFKIYVTQSSAGFTAPGWDRFTIEALASTPSPCEAWLLGHSLPSDADLTADRPGFETNLLQAYAFGLDPEKSAPVNLALTTSESGTLCVRFFAARNDIIYTPQTTEHLDNWITGGISVSDIDGSGQRTATVSTAQTRRFLRILIEKTGD